MLFNTKSGFDFQCVTKSETFVLIIRYLKELLFFDESLLCFFEALSLLYSVIYLSML